MRQQGGDGDVTDETSLRVTMDAPRLDWTVTAIQTPVLRVLNAVSSRLPLWTWRSARLVRVREGIARRLHQNRREFDPPERGYRSSRVSSRGKLRASCSVSACRRP